MRPQACGKKGEARDKTAVSCWRGGEFGYVVVVLGYSSEQRGGYISSRGRGGVVLLQCAGLCCHVTVQHSNTPEVSHT